jgi:hypothetical protein
VVAPVSSSGRQSIPDNREQTIVKDNRKRGSTGSTVAAVVASVSSAAGLAAFVADRVVGIWSASGREVL